MVVFPHAKINLGLNVVRRREDGYHDIETILLPIPLCDALEAVIDPSVPAGEVVFTRSGLPVPGEPMDDLCIKAHGLVAARRRLPGMRVHLHKAVPIGSGSGGGSSDGAHMLLLLDRLAGLGLGQGELHGLALELGSDCPFFLQQGPQLAQGRGERLAPVRIELAGTWLLLVNPGVHLSTAAVYRASVPTGRSLPLADIVRTCSMDQWREELPNVLEPAAMAIAPVVGEALHRMQQLGAVHWAMSGSGSTVFGLFRQEPPRQAWPEGWSAWTYRL